MTQILIPSTDILRTHEAREAVDALLAALDAAEAIPTDGGGTSPISGQTYARYGALIRFDHQRLATDVRGPAGEKRWATYTTPQDASAVLMRMLEESREIFGITAVRGALGGTTRV